MKVNGQWVPRVRNSYYSFISSLLKFYRCLDRALKTYNFIPILLKLYRCVSHALKMCIWFGYNPQINFDTFFAI